MSENLYLQLLIKSESGALSPEEARALEQWLQVPENARRAGEYRAIWEKSADYQVSVPVDTEVDFQRVLAKIGRQTKPAARRIALQPLLRVAAAIVLLVAAVGIFRLLQPAEAPMQTVVASNTELKTVELPDGTRVWLRRNAGITYPETFAADQRRVRLSGEAYFEVAHAPEKPFLVAVEGGGTVTVLGTKFSIRQEAAGTVVLVRSGKVRYQAPGTTKTVDLTAGRRASYDAAARKVKVGEALSFNELAWQTGGLEFINTPMFRVVEDLNAYYGVKIELRNSDLRHCTLTAPLTSQPIDQVLNGLSVAYELTVEHPAPDTYVLKGGACPE